MRGEGALAAPPPHRRLVLFSCPDPIADAAVGAVLSLPERRVRLQIVHEKLRRGESLSAVLARGGDEDDGLAGTDQAIAVDDEHALERPSPARLVDDPLDLRFRHAGIMFDFERREGAPFITAKPCEGDNSANVAAPMC